MSNVLNEVTKLFKIKKINTTAYHPESNGALERSHHTLSEYLTHFINIDQSDCDSWLDFAMFSYNTTTHSSTKYSPYELVFGNKPDLPSSVTRPVEFKYTYDNYLDDLILKLQKSHELAKENIIQSKEKNKHYYDKKSRNIEFNIGDSVYLENHQIKKGNTKKFSKKYSGPYKIVKLNPPVNCTLKINNKNVRVHKNRLKHHIVLDS